MKWKIISLLVHEAYTYTIAITILRNITAFSVFCIFIVTLKYSKESFILICSYEMTQEESSGCFGFDYWNAILNCLTLNACT